ncbi:MAG: hypothetical protein HAW60_06220 [Bdellovibrionales bacterium]|nr:hypothetical protein [Bdellovibrionales bacterium]
MLSVLMLKVILYVGAGHAIVTASDYAGCKTKVYSKSYCAVALLKYKVQETKVNKIKKKLKKKKKCKWYKKC